MVRLPKCAIFSGFFAALIFCGFLVFGARSTFAAVTSCVVTVYPSSKAPSVTDAFAFSIYNYSSSATITWLRITGPSNITITSADTSPYTIDSSTSITFTNLSIASQSGYQYIVVGISTGSSGSSNWSIYASDSSDGSGAFTCLGLTPVSITSDQSDIVAPDFTSNPTPSDVADTSVKVNWTTDESSSTYIAYGTSSQYTQSKHDTTNVTSHSVELTGLSANTGYSFMVESADGAGNVAWQYGVFSTSKSPTTTTTTVTVTVVASPSPTPDTTLPRVVFVNTDFAKIYRDPPAISGEAFDAGGVSKVEFSTTGGKSWQVVPKVDNLGSVSVNFSVTPILSGDGNFLFVFRAQDKSGNIGLSKVETLKIDRTAPTVSLDTDFSRPFKVTPEISGSAYDLNGVSKVEYSSDNGLNWLNINSLGIAEGGRVVFSFNPSLREDNNYLVKIRAYDPLDNMAESEAKTLVIDRLPPAIGGGLYSIGPYVLEAGDRGQLTILANVEVKAIFSAVGGPTSVDISTKLAGTSEEESRFSLLRNNDNGLWFGKLKFAQVGVYDLMVYSVDGANNKTERKLQSFLVLPYGRISKGGMAVHGAKITVWEFDGQLFRFRKWNGEIFGQQNPIGTLEDGSYGAFLPPGKYYLEVKADGLKTVRTSIFTIDDPKPVNADFELKPVSGGFLGRLLAILPDLPWNFESLQIDISPKLDKRIENSSLLDRKRADLDRISSQNFELGRPTVLTFVNTWLPEVTNQINSLEEISDSPVNVIVVIPQESKSKIELFARRGLWDIAISADPDGELVQRFDIQSLPQHFFFDRAGVLKKVISQTLSAAEILDKVER